MLAGGKRRTADTALVSLYRYGAVTVDGSEFQCLAAPPASAHPLEHELWERLRYCPSGMPPSRACLLLPEALRRLEDRLEALDLLLERARQRWCLAVALIAPALAVFRIVSGESSDESADFLVLVSMVAIATALVVFARPPVRTLRGQRLLEAMRRRRSTLRRSWHRKDTAETPLAGWAVAMFGLASLQDTPLAELAKTLRARDASVAASSGAGGAGLGSGCSGGGCGGGGCGGGGCGGSGS
jgi:uncharacterized protein (TIGR04222 family)